ncbi:MAG: FtsW/RodA/SpoVE family cell cycle protein [Candidatus Saccharibacteria bacterium]|nr:FtsW/RodA/SpoVE family cell cycle protein [Candidatus Saccharibacteria bacterium]
MRRHKGDVSIIVLTVILMIVGLLVMYTIGPTRANFLNATYGSNYSDSYFFLHQLLSVGLALGVFYLFNKIEYQKIAKYSKIALMISLGLCAILAVAQFTNLPIARCELGACRWFSIMGISVQPAEFLKFSIILYLATIFSKYKAEGGELLKNMKFLTRYVLSVGLSLLFVVVIQKDLGSGLPIITIALSILFVSGVSVKSFLLIVLAVLILGVGAIMTSGHRRERLFTYLGFSVSEEEEDGDAYHIENALIAIGTGGLFGVGIGNSVQATGYLPESINDSVFAILGEMFGFVGLVALLFLFAWLLFRVLKVSDYSRDFQNSLIVVGVFAWIMTHLVVNIMSMTGITPLTGITLPLLSYGGTSMMAVAGALGLVYQLSGYTSREVIIDNEREPEKTTVSRFETNNYTYRRRR